MNTNLWRAEKSEVVQRPHRRNRRGDGVFNHRDTEAQRWEGVEEGSKLSVPLGLGGFTATVCRGPERLHRGGVLSDAFAGLQKLMPPTDGRLSPCRRCGRGVM